MKILESFVASPFAGAIGWTLLHSLWEGARIAALLAAVLLATRSARLRYAAACVAMIAMVSGVRRHIYRWCRESAQNFAHCRMPLCLAPDVAIRARTRPPMVGDSVRAGSMVGAILDCRRVALSLAARDGLCGGTKASQPRRVFRSEEWQRSLPVWPRGCASRGRCTCSNPASRKSRWCSAICVR